MNASTDTIAARRTGLRTGLGVALLFLLLAAPARAASGYRIAVTLDDVPWVGGLAPGDTKAAATARILAALRAHDVPATALVVCDRLAPKAPVLRRWLAAGMTIGSHTSTHPHLDDMKLADWEQNVARCKRKLEKITGAPVSWFRYPYLQRGRTEQRRDAARAVLDRLGHRIAPVTVDSSEWALVKPYVAARKAGDGDRAAEIGAAWVTHVKDAVDHFRKVARETVGRDVAHVLLLHANAPAADHLDTLLDALVADGAEFVPLEVALRDPVYSREDHYAGPIGLSWLYRIDPKQPAGERWAWDRAQWKAIQRRFGEDAKD